MPPTSPYAIPNVPTTEGTGWLRLLQKTGGQEGWNPYVDSLESWQRDFLERDPQAGFGAYQTIQGQGMGSAYQSWLSRQYDRYRNQYSTMMGQNPALFWTDFLREANPEADYKLLATPYERGEYRSGFSLAPTMRMSW